MDVGENGNADFGPDAEQLCQDLAEELTRVGQELGLAPKQDA